MSQRQKPPFRGDMVGSLLRSAPVKEARAKLAAGEIGQAELTAIEDEEIRKLVRKQEEVGLQAVTDGEFRRAFWHFDFLDGLSGVTSFETDSGIQFKGVTTKGHAVRVTGKLDFPDDHPHLAHFKFLASTTSRVPKMTIPSPSMLHYRGGRKAIDPSAYLRIEDYYEDLGKVYAKAIKAFYDAGCRYLQLDDTSLSYFCDPEQRKMLAERGDDPEQLVFIYRDVLNAALKAKPADMQITTHTCRGNFKSTFIASGGYEPVAEMVFNEINVDGYFMEWDDDRSGGFEPLRFLPKGDKQVVLGLVTSKFGEIESKDNLKRRIESASKYAPLEQLCLSPQCGFASTEEGNVLAEDEQWAKLSRILEVAKEVWG
ncbi:5-methyltetrahydropteroyltriglutamate--homocysteine methyltransferase [Bosea lupini]|uniref:5-methyltetrahydropteroyltriglutamate--homocysteine methyltransferase n=1 Tax=Bosea lupini TaxID=1036779 RepID=A0A1H7T0W3_9HYPH|nr:5-methyltetrahydropteroyltriglutamate--homocysteine S-methyltransferase [Bosea lupini]SEL78129.1 5-methyltetrahydropteroyltriglutamate--homocysteine methyltransferase [Bosea lupini]